MYRYLSKSMGLVFLLTAIACERAVTFSEVIPPVSEITEILHTSNSSYITLDQAKEVADIFIGAKDAVPLTRVTQSNTPEEASVQSISKDGEPLMYVVNYDDGGFVITSATRDYLPILAYSETGRFDVSLIQGGLALWVDETMAAVEASKEKADSVKLSMNRLWSLYEPTAQNEVLTTESSRNMTYTPAEIACFERCDELFLQYGGNGWNFLPLSLAEQVFDDAGLSYYYDNLCYSAQFNNSGISSSVVGWKEGSFTESYGPMLTTQWHQGTPYNDLCYGHPAGCGVIALAQVMKHHAFPQNFVYNNTEYFDWTTIPDNPTSTSNHSKLIKYVYDMTSTNYLPLFDVSWTTPGAMEDAITAMGFNVTRQDDDPQDVEYEVLRNHRPVIMLGHDSNSTNLPGDAEYVGNSHYWVVDGVQSVDTDVFMVFAEWQPNDSGQFTQSHYSIDNPDVISGISYLYYHYNMGWGGINDGWYGFNYDYPYLRQNFLISRIF